APKTPVTGRSLLASARPRPKARHGVLFGPAQQTEDHPGSRVARPDPHFWAVRPEDFNDRQDIADLGLRALAAVLLFDRLHLGPYVFGDPLLINCHFERSFPGRPRSASEAVAVRRESRRAGG